MKMNTSALIAELLLGGGLVELVSLLALDHLSNGYVLSWLLSLDGMGAALLVSGAIVLAYYLGSLLNTLSRLIFRPVEQRVRKEILGPLSSDEGLRRRLSILVKSPELYEHIEELYAQIRVFRAAGVAFGTLIVVLALRDQPTGNIKWFLVGAASIVAAGSAIGTASAMRSYFRVLRVAHENLVESSKKEDRQQILA